ASILRSPGPSSRPWPMAPPSPASSCGSPSSRVVGALAVEAALERSPRALAAALEALELLRDVLGHRIGRQHHLLAALRGGDLRAAGWLEVVHLVEGVAYGAAGRQQAVMAQDHRVVLAEVAHQPLALVEIERDAFVVVVAEAAEEVHRHLVQR